MIVIKIPESRTANCVNCQISMILNKLTWVVCDRPVCSHCYWNLGDLRKGQLR
jgi:hypothetical protein